MYNKFITLQLPLEINVKWGEMYDYLCTGSITHFRSFRSTDHRYYYMTRKILDSDWLTAAIQVLCHITPCIFI